MDKIDNSKLVLEMFNFKKGLLFENDDIERQINFHMGLFNCDNTGKLISQKNIIRNLTEKLTPFTYDSKVVGLLENLNGIIKNDELFYELEDLYRTLESSNQGMVYRHVMKIVLDIINETNSRNQQVKILTELALHDWIPSVKNFIFKLTTDPMKRQNITSNGGKAEHVFSIVEKINTDTDKGFLTFIGDKWFFLNEKGIDAKNPFDFYNEREKLYKLELLKKALEIGHIEEDKITFKVDEDITIGFSLSDKKIYMNNEKTDSSATLESIFDSALIPYVRKDLYPIISETYKNLDKFVNLDIVQKITNITNPHLECFVFNYKDNIYLYSKDGRYGNHFYEYESATILCNEMNQKLGYDLSEFLKNKFTDEIKVKKDLEGKEKFITDKLVNINENIKKLKECGLLEINEEIKMAHQVLNDEKTILEKELFTIKSALSSLR